MKTTMRIKTGAMLSFLAVSIGTGLCQAGGGIGVSTQNGQATVTFNGREVWSGPVHGSPVARSSSVNGVTYAAVFDGNQLLWESAPGAAQKMGKGDVGQGTDVDKFLKEHQQNFERMKEEQRQFIEKHQKDFSTGGGGGGTSGGKSWSTGGGGSSGTGSTVTISTGDVTLKRVNGDTTLQWRGKNYKLGKTTGRLSTKLTNENGRENLVILDDDRLVWESLVDSSEKAR